MPDADFSKDDHQVDVCGGVARLPQSSSNLPVLLTVEIEVDSTDQCVLAVHVNPDLGGLKRIIDDAVVGKPVSSIASAGAAAIMSHYHSPFRNAARAALVHAWEAYEQSGKASLTPEDQPQRLRRRFLD